MQMPASIARFRATKPAFRSVGAGWARSSVRSIGPRPALDPSPSGLLISRPRSALCCLPRHRLCCSGDRSSLRFITTPTRRRSVTSIQEPSGGRRGKTGRSCGTISSPCCGACSKPVRRYSPRTGPSTSSGTATQRMSTSTSPNSPVYDEAGEVGGVLCIVRETTDRFVARRELARAQERLTQALNAHGMVGTFDWHVQTDVVYSDARFAEMFSVDPANAQKGAPLAEYLAGIHPEDVERIAAAVNHVVATGEKYIKEFRLLRKDGTIRWVEARGECLSDEDGKPVRLVGVVGDITNQKEAQERQGLLPREMNHRVKNLFSIIQGMIRLSARSARTAQDLAESLLGRLDALMRAKDLVRPGMTGSEQAQSERTTLDVLVRTVLRPYADDTYRER